MCTCACAYVHVEARVHVLGYSLGPVHRFTETESLSGLKPVRLGLPASRSQNLSPVLQHWESQVHPYLDFYGIGFRSSWLHGGHCMIVLPTQVSL